MLIRSFSSRSSAAPIAIGALFAVGLFPILAHAGTVLSDDPITVREGEVVDAKVGWAVSTAGDVNGDGLSDILVGSGFVSQTVWCYHGSTTAPYITLAWTATSDQPNAAFGLEATAAGDVNGDGYGDVIIGASNYNNGEFAEGRVYVYLGSPAGLEAAPQRILESNVVNASFGSDLSTAGDVNGDGYDDILIGAPNYTDGEQFEGRAYVYPGSAAGVADVPAWTIEGNVANLHYGQNLSDAGDVNADGYDDIVVQAPEYSNGQTSEGIVYLYFGSSEGLSTTPDWSWESNLALARAGTGLGCGGDINGDGYGDIVMDTENSGTGRVLAHFGGPSGPDGIVDRSFATTTNVSANDVFTAGDLNGDGFADVIVDDRSLNTTGAIRILTGSANGAVFTEVDRRQGSQANESFGQAVRPAGDVNGDGFGDVIVGAPFYSNGVSFAGRALLYLGQGPQPATTPAWGSDGPQPNATQGYTVAQGDWNGDGYDDLATGSPLIDFVGNNSGFARVFYGGPNGFAAVPDWFVLGMTSWVGYGWSIANAGDIDNDGDDELLVGEPYHASGEFTQIGKVYLYQGSPSGLEAVASWTRQGGTLPQRLGFSVAGAGDVNGDGFADFLVGAPTYETATEKGGRAYLYYGSPTGPSAEAVWIGHGAATGDEFGECVTGAGDLNGDGYSDIAIGASWADVPATDAGTAYVYYGSADGISGGVTLTLNNVSDASTARFGDTIAAAGDMNADGYGDLVIAAPSYDVPSVPLKDLGLVNIYLGSPTGVHVQSGCLCPTPAQSFSYTGTALASGDVNLDGYSDVAVGAAGQNNVGAAYVFMGTPNGVGVGVPWSQFGSTPGGLFGFSASLSGDVTGDGFPDLVVGAPYGGASAEGQVRVFYSQRPGMGAAEGGLLRQPRQFRSDAVTPVSPRGASDETSAIVLSAVARSARGRDHLRAEYEIEPAGTLFGNTILEGGGFDTGAPVPGVGSAVRASVSALGLSPETAYHWRLRFKSESPYFPHTAWFSLPGNSMSEFDARTAGVTTDVTDNETGSNALRFARIDGNPVVTATRMFFDAPVSGHVKLTVHDVAGRLVATVLDEEVEAGRHSASWNARSDGGDGVASGVYLVRLDQHGETAVTKLVVAR